MNRFTDRHRNGARWIVRTNIPGKNVGDVPHNGCDLDYQYYSGKIIDRLGELENLYDNRVLTDMDIDEGEPYYIVEDGRYYVVDHINEDAIFFVGRNSGILRDKVGQEYHIHCRKPE